MYVRPESLRPEAETTNVPRLKLLALIYLFFTGTQVVLQLLNGSSLGCAFLWSLCIAVGFAFVFHGGLYNTVVWMGLIFIARYVGLASLLKIGLGQPLDSPLNTPFDTYLMTFCVIVELYVAYRLISRVPLRVAIFKKNDDLDFLNIFSVLTFVVGSIVFFLTSFRSGDDLDLAGFRVFMECIFVMGVVSRTAYVLKKSSLRKNMDLLLLVMLGCGFLYSMLSNQKSIAIHSMLAYVLTLIGVRRALPPLKIMLLGAVFVWLVAAVMAPVIFTLRSMDAKNKTMSERFVDIADYLSRGSLDEARDLTSLYHERSEEILAYFGPIGSLNSVAQRVGLVQPADAIKRGIDANGFMGLSFLAGGFTRIIPRVLNPEKDMDWPSDVICWHAGVQDKKIVNLQAIGIVSGSYAVAGWTGVLLIPLMLFSAYFFIQRLWAGTSVANIFAVYFVVANQNKFVEFDPSSLIGTVCKDIELEMIAFLGLIFLAKLILNAITAGRLPKRVRPRVSFEAVARR